MIRTIKGVVKTIRDNKQREIVEEPFNGYGFMRRVYGTEETGEIDDIDPMPEMAASDVEPLPKPFKHVRFENDIDQDID